MTGLTNVPPLKLYETAMKRLSEIPDNTIKFNSVQAGNLGHFVTKLYNELVELGEVEKAETLYNTANRKFFTGQRG